MSTTTSIEWTERTWNPLTGCTRVSAGCDNCYAARQAATRLKNTAAYEGLAVITPSGRAAFNGKIRLLSERLSDPLHWRKPSRVFVNSMSDLFHESVADRYIARVFAVMAGAPRHTFQILTKRPQRMPTLLQSELFWGMVHAFGMEEYWDSDALVSVGEIGPDAVLPNVWLGTSVEDQAAADERIPHLLRTPAAVRFVSCEPLLGPVVLWRWLDNRCWDCDGDESCPSCGGAGRHGDDILQSLHWVIVGGESGSGARPCNIAWIESIIGQCRSAGVPVFCKQLGAKPYDRFVSLDNPNGDWRGSAADQADIDSKRIGIADPKGGDMAEWPERLRVREYPYGVGSV